jgi:hypothetical protein
MPPERELRAQAENFEYVFWHIPCRIVRENPRPNGPPLLRATCNKWSAAALGDTHAKKKPFPRTQPEWRTITAIVRKIECRHGRPPLAITPHAFEISANQLLEFRSNTITPDLIAENNRPMVSDIRWYRSYIGIHDPRKLLRPRKLCSGAAASRLNRAIAGV